MLPQGLIDLVVGGLFAALGGSALALSLLRYRRIDPLLAAFGAFAGLFGVRQLLGSELIPELGLDGPARPWIIYTITYVINIPAWMFFWRLLGRRWASVLSWWLGAVSLFAVVAIASDVVQGTPGTLAGAPNNVMVLLGMALVAVVLFLQRGDRSTDEKILLWAFLPMALLVVNDNLVSIGALPWDWREESIGLVLFVACLGVITARRYFARERRLASLESELETARRIQQSLLPEHSAGPDAIAIAVRFQPSSAVAGDLYDFLAPGDEALGIVVADVSGHGVPAALLASMVKVAFGSAADSVHDAAELLAKVNRTLCESLPSGFVTAGYARFDRGGRSLVVANAGHPPPLLLRASEDAAREIGGQGPILGRFPDARFFAERVELEPGDRLVLFTDGLLEARGADDEMFGDARLADLVARRRRLDGEALCDEVLDELCRWTGRRAPLELEDDLTLLVVDVATPTSAG